MKKNLREGYTMKRRIVKESYEISPELEDRLNSILADEFLAAEFYRLAELAMKGNKQHRLSEIADENGEDELEDHFKNLSEWMQSKGIRVVTNHDEMLDITGATVFTVEDGDSTKDIVDKLIQSEEEAIEAYEQGRLSDNEYLERMLQFKEDVLNHTDSELPTELEHNNAAKAYYGIALENYKRLFPNQPIKEMALATTKAFNDIIRKTVIVDNAVLVDWQSKSDIIGKMKIELEDELIDNVKRKYGLDFSFDDMDIIIDGCVDVAKIWIR